MVTHDPVAAGHSDEVVFLADGPRRRPHGRADGGAGAAAIGTGTGVGVGLGAFLGWAICRDLELPPTIPVGQLVLLAAAATALAVAAAALPARRAARLDPVRVVAAE
jgi:hypothetical protein